MADIGKDELQSLLKTNRQEVVSALQPYLNSLNGHLTNIEASLDRIAAALGTRSAPTTQL